MHEAFVNIRRVPTRILTHGAWIEESMDNVSEVVICITGNPGLVGFYKEFAQQLHERIEQKMPVWIIGHMGQDDPPATSLREVPQLKGNEELFDLKSQVLHKLEFIERFVPAGAKIHLVGHSIGAWMVLQLLRKTHIRARIKHCYLLFPTVERMIESPNGWIFTKIVLPLYSVFNFVIVMFNWLPPAWRLLLIHMYLWLLGIPRNLAETALNYTRCSVLEKVVFLAEDEMARVRGLQRDVIQQYGSLLTFYYGTTDGWVPINYYEQLRAQYPQLHVLLDDKRVDHAFVIHHNSIMANIVADLIIEHSNLFNFEIERDFLVAF